MCMPNNKAECLAIIEAYEGMLRQEWRRDLVESWTYWKAVLVGME